MPTACWGGWSRLPPESLAVPVDLGLRFDFDIAIHSCLARQSQILFVPQTGEIRDRPQHQSQLFEHSLRAEVFNPLGDLHAAASAQTESHAIDVLVNPGI